MEIKLKETCASYDCDSGLPMTESFHRVYGNFCPKCCREADKRSKSRKLSVETFLKEMYGK